MKIKTFAVCAVLLGASSAFARPPGDPVPVRPGPVTLPTQDLTTGLTPEDLVNALLGGGVTVSNVTFVGSDNCAGLFSGGAGIVGFEDGVVLGSGNIATINGPENTSDSAGQANGNPGDADLETLIPGFTTFDACIIEFDFECDAVDQIAFEYVLLSDEYNEFVFDIFNDVFGFFLNGTNIAIVPGDTVPVAIDNVNCDNPYNPPAGGNNCNLYINNDCTDLPAGSNPCTGPVATEMDGLTVVFTATGAVNPGLNHIKLAIADAGDEGFDSNVLLRGESFECAIPTGACCDTNDFTCQNGLTEDQCQGPGEVFNVGLDCDQLDPPCIEPTGACCDDSTGTCTDDETQTNCENAGFRYGGDDSTCMNIDPACVAPATGACCDDANFVCTEGVTQAACEGQGFRYGGDDSTCATIDPPCVEPTGACCDDSNGVCTEAVTQSACDGAGLRYGGDGSTCATITPPCLAPVFVDCCLSTGQCVTVLEGTCSGEVVNSCLGDSDGDGNDDACVPPEVDEPVPTMSTGGMAILLLLLTVGLALAFRRKASAS